MFLHSRLITWCAYDIRGVFLETSDFNIGQVILSERVARVDVNTRERSESKDLLAGEFNRLALAR